MRDRLNTGLMILLAVFVLSLWFGKDLLQSGKKGSTAEPLVTGTATTFAMSEEDTPIHLAVLNGTTEPGLARDVGLLLGRGGCVVESVGNTPGRDWARSFLVNRRLSDRKGAGLARRLGGIRVIREWDGRGSEDAVLVLGGDFHHLLSCLEGERTAKYR